MTIVQGYIHRGVSLIMGQKIFVLIKMFTDYIYLDFSLISSHITSHISYQTLRYKIIVSNVFLVKRIILIFIKDKIVGWSDIQAEQNLKPNLSHFYINI